MEILDLSCILFLLLFFLKGFWNGDSPELLNWVLWAFLGLLVYLSVPDSLSQEQNLSLGPIILLSGAFVLVLLLFPLLFTLGQFSYHHLEYFPKLSSYRRVLGGCFSFLRGMVFLMLALNFASRLPLKSNQMNRSFFVQRLVEKVSEKPVLILEDSEKLF